MSGFLAIYEYIRAFVFENPLPIGSVLRCNFTYFVWLWLADIIQNHIIFSNALWYLLLKMFYVVILLDSKVIKIVPEKWININKYAEKYKNFGVRAGVENFVVFNSPDEHDEPVFNNLTIKKVFDANKAAFYEANILYIFGKNFFCIVLFILQLGSVIVTPNTDYISHSPKHLLADNYDSAKNYVDKKRAIIPVKYCDVRRNRKRSAGIKATPAQLIAKKVIKLEKNLQLKEKAISHLQKDMFSKQMVIIIDDDDEQDGHKHAEVTVSQENAADNQADNTANNQAANIAGNAVEDNGTIN